MCTAASTGCWKSDFRPRPSVSRLGLKSGKSILFSELFSRRLLFTSERCVDMFVNIPVDRQTCRNLGNTSWRSFFATLDAMLCAIGRWLVQPLGTRIAVVTLLSIHAGLLAYSATRHRPTVLEPAFLVAGLSEWEFGRHHLFLVNPPLSRRLSSLPVLASGYEMKWEGLKDSPAVRPEFRLGSQFVDRNGERCRSLFTLARWASIPISLLGGYLCYCWSSDLWNSPSAGLLSCSLWCFEPMLVGHAELITADCAGATFGHGACYFFWRWVLSPSVFRTVTAGVFTGLALSSKLSWILLVAAWPIILGSLALIAGCGRNWSAGEQRLRVTGDYLLRLCFLAFVAIWTVNTIYIWDGVFCCFSDRT